MQYSIYGQNPKYPLAELVDPVVSGFLIISQEEVVTLLNAKDYRIAELESLLKRVSKDLLMRAELDSDGFKVVDLSSSIWINLKEALKEQE